MLDSLLVTSEKNFSKFSYIKELPKSPNLTHLKEVRDTYIYLKSINIDQRFINSIATSKVDYFADQVSVLDASEMNDFSDNKRYTLLICFIYKNLMKTGDDLITRFIKLLGKIHNRAKENSEKILEDQRSKTENTVNIFHQILITSQNWNRVGAK